MPDRESWKRGITFPRRRYETGTKIVTFSSVVRLCNKPQQIVSAKIGPNRFYASGTNPALTYRYKYLPRHPWVPVANPSRDIASEKWPRLLLCAHRRRRFDLLSGEIQLTR